VEITRPGDVPSLWKTEATRAVYQTLNVPTADARETRRATDLRMDNSLARTDGAPSLSPFRVSFKGWGSTLEGARQALRQPSGRTFVWASVLYGACGAALASVWPEHQPAPWWPLAGLAVVAIAAERSSVRLTSRIETSISFLPLIFTAVAFGPLAALMVAALGNLGDLRRPYLKWVVYTAIRGLTGLSAGLAAMTIEAGRADSYTKIFIVTFAAAGASVVADLLLNFGTIMIRGAGTVRGFFCLAGPLLALSLPLYVPLVALLVYGYRVYSLWIVVVFLLSAMALQRLMQLYQEQREAVQRFAETNMQLQRANLSFATALVATLDARDEYTAGHSAAVATYARDIAERMGLSAEQQQLAHLCGLVHDIGKVGLPSGLLEKPGPLTRDERRQMEEHAAIGERILRNVDTYEEIALIVRHHHERVDGEGYPDRLRRDEIPLLSRIITVADAYDAMTSDRPYRNAMPPHVARLRLANAVESQFDTSVVAAFEAILTCERSSYGELASSGFRAEISEVA
jgi:putative nucleotidyltransferase with HDIG domain